MTTMADIAPESVLLAGAGRAILLQIAHPSIGYGVARHSDFASRPMDRLNGTLTYIYALTSGTEEDKRAVRRAVNRAHRPVRNVPGASAPNPPDSAPVTAPPAAEPAASLDPAYDARDPHLQLWVAATLYDTAITVFELVHGPLDEASADHVYREYALLGTALQMPEELWPADRAAFRRYFERTVQELSVDDTVRGVAVALLRAEKGPLPLRVGMPIARFVTVALLPEPVRSAFGYAWSGRRERRFRRLLRVAGPLYRALPERLRRAPQRHYLARLHAASAAAPAPA
ncbi:DUF2236 domain-containing protein [Herbiconiux sp. CPCC 203407]|uniref:DUF2236 domain-containing protein n=1 Tax=Herbiconiux oxytropis TaxID=2970915 RepID=A0AA41XED4_9MICO|nr:oxygenase MpaB family protein [Herbiconiux oxytropis]MCS5722512.1 DUF2236 domain-containing protein [Herbiconiux oxytropis]MCS5726452.1 DUF2236 domain-containing protein [Herbiconiux oxytropis]